MPKRINPETLIAAALLCAAAVIGLATASDYGITIDEWNADDYGPKALAWYTSGFTDRAMFDQVEETLWYYGPWFHVLIAAVQSLGVAAHWTVRHAMTFLIGLAGIALILPMARRAFGRWAGLTAIALCLTTGYLYGSIFITPIDVPFLFAMTAATLAIMVMAERTVPSWPATVIAGLLTGLAIATRSSAFITHAYLIAAMLLCAVEVASGDRGVRRKFLMQIGVRTIAAMLVAWLVAIALWPWLQIGNPFTQFAAAFVYFANHPAAYEFMHWGKLVTSSNLPWSYVPGELAARLPEGFLLLLVAGLLFGLGDALGVFAQIRRTWRAGWQSVAAAALRVARSRQAIVVWAAALLPVGFVMLQGSTLYNGVRHVLFVIPVLAAIAGYGFVRLLPFLTRFPRTAAAGIGGYLVYLVVVLVTLHPLEYIAFNSLAGGVYGAYGRFHMDYWAVSATVALRRLEEQIDRESPDRFRDDPPKLMVCILSREGLAEAMHGRPWRLETDPEKADYLIATQDWRCDEDQSVVLIDEVKRFDRAFAWTFARRPRQAESLRAAQSHP